MQFSSEERKNCSAIITLIKHFWKMSNNKRESLHEAIDRDESEMILNRLNSSSFDKIDLEEISDWGVTPLEHAIEIGNLQIVEYLIRAGADIYFGVNDFLLNVAVRKIRFDIVKLLIDSGVDINLKGEGGQTALMDAACSSSIEIVHLLVEHGANADDIRDDGMSALACAALMEREHIFNYLFDYTSTNIRDVSIAKADDMRQSDIENWGDDVLF